MTRRVLTYKAIIELIAEGRGQGSGKDYVPWIKVQEFMSQGQRNRVLGWITERQHDYFSLGELYYHYYLDFSNLPILDIQEQFPLFSLNPLSPLEETLSIAKYCGIHHPIDPDSKDPVPLTTDFVITIARPVGATRIARTIKPTDKLTKRVIEKFEIERRYWLARNVDWKIVTEHEIDSAVGENIDWFHPYLRLSSVLTLSTELIIGVRTTLTEMVVEGSRPLCDITSYCDDRLGLEPGTALSVARHLIASKQWRVDIRQRIHPCRELALLDVSLIEPSIRR